MDEVKINLQGKKAEIKKKEMAKGGVLNFMPLI